MNTWIVAEHKTLESCIQYIGKEQWRCWTSPPPAIGDVLVSRMGRFVVSAVEVGAEEKVDGVPQMYNVVAKPEVPAA